VENIVEYEELVPTEAVEPVEFRVARGIVFTVVPSEIVFSTTSSQ
jgi:hypothetical protein